MNVTIIGAGIIGASCAYYLSKRGLNVTVLEQNRAPAMGSTAKSAAGIRHQFSHAENIKMSLYSAGEYENFEEITGLSSGYRKVGYLLLVDEKLQEKHLEAMKLQKSLGVRVDYLTAKATQEQFDYIDVEGLVGSSLGHDDGILDPNAISFGYLNAAKAKGAKIILESKVNKLSFKNNQWRISTSNRTFKTDAIINAAGPHAAQVAKLAGFDISVLPYRRNIYITGPMPNFKHPSPLIIDMTTGVYLRSEGERIIFGLSNHNEIAGFKETVDWDWLEHNLSLALPRFPFLNNAGLDYKSSWAGLYSITPDHFPILGRMPNSSFYNAVGFSGHGVQHAAAVGLILAEEIIDAEVTSFDIRDFRFERFADIKTNRETNIF